MNEWNIKLENVLEKRKIEVGKDDAKNFQLFISKSYCFQNLIPKTSTFLIMKIQFLIWFHKYYQKYKIEFEGL